MPERTKCLEGTIFEYEKKSLRVQSHVTAVVSCPSYGEQTVDQQNDDTFDLSQDYWTPRNSRLEITFRISLSEGLPFEALDKHKLARVLYRSTSSAELWAQLGFQLCPDSTSPIPDLSHSAVYFKLLLVDTRQFTKDDKVLNLKDLYGRDLSNLRPPLPVTVINLKSINVSLHFTPVTSCVSNLHFDWAKKTDTLHYSSYVRLVDVALRNSLCQKTMRSRGVNQLLSFQSCALPGIAPSVFVPGYTDSVSSRAHLIEPIAKLLHLYMNADTTKFSHASNKHLFVEHNHFSREERLKIESNLWAVMANALKALPNPQNLKPLKVILDEPSDQLMKSPSGVFHTIEAPEDLYFMDVREGELHYQDDMFFDLLDSAHASDPFPAQGFEHLDGANFLWNDCPTGGSDDMLRSDMMLDHILTSKSYENASNAEEVLLHDQCDQFTQAEIPRVHQSLVPYTNLRMDSPPLGDSMESIPISRSRRLSMALSEMSLGDDILGME